MDDPNQGLPDAPALAPMESALGEAPAPRPSLLPWLAIVVFAGIGGLLIGQAELAVLAVLGGLFAVAHAGDLDPERSFAYLALAWVVPAGSAVAFTSLGIILAQSDLPVLQRGAGLAVAALGAAVGLASGFRPVAHALARTLFGVTETSRALRLAARLAVSATLLSLPAGLAFSDAAEQFTRSGESLVGGALGLWGNLLGLVLLALGGVGFLVRRDARGTLARLGIAALRPPQLLVVALGMAALVALNGGAEWLQRMAFPALWAHDQQVNQMIAGSLSRPETMLLGLSAGLGEEIALRGALQPRLGVARTSILFALLHVQYSWYGMAIIAVLGLLLGAIRQRTSTTVAIVVHALYDVAAVVTLKP
jgi:CAAX prenyl protease-like protein